MLDLVDKFFGCSAEDVREVRGFYKKSDRDVECDVGILREWLRKQEHLPQHTDDAVLERLLMRNKFRVELTKEKLDLHFTAKTHYKDFLAQADPACDPIKSRMELMTLMTFPKLTPSKERVWILKWNGGKQTYNFDEVTLMAVMILEIQLKCDYGVAERIMLDFDGFGWTQFKTITPTMLIRALYILKEVFSARIAGLEILYPPSYVSHVLALLKIVVPPKLFSRITVHKDNESLHKSIPKNCLPEDYGGTLAPMSKLYAEYKEMWISTRKWMVPALRTMSNESLRIGENKYGSMDVFGVDGTFKKLEVD